MKNKAFLGLCTVLSCTGSASMASEVNEGQQSNTIFILVDDMGYGELSCYNSNTPTPTPNIDALAKSGVIMTQAYASPVSAPTRAAFLTGYFPQNVGVFGNGDGTTPGIGPMRPCFVEKLKENGYNTAWLGKWHQGWDVSNHPINNGFDTTYGFLGGMHDFFDATEGSHYIGGPFAKNCYIFDGIKPVTEMKYLTEELTDRAVSFINNQDKDTPFHIYLAYNAPHTPIQAPDEDIVKYLKMGYEPLVATRYAMMDVLDTQVGRVIDAISEKDLRNNTLIVFMSDNGPETDEFSGELRGKKMTAWEGGIRVPMVASMPGVIPSGQKSNSICSITDMASTFIGLSIGDDDYQYGDGVNLMPYFKGTKRGNAHDNLVFSIHLHGKPFEVPTPENFDLFAVRMKDWKLVVDRGREINALYNLKSDLSEKNDLSETHADKKTELLEYGREFLRNAKPASEKIRRIDTRIDGDTIKKYILIDYCNKLKETYNIK